MSIRITVLAVLFSSISTACVQIEEYPSNWENLSGANTAFDCAAISGVYSNIGTKPDGARSWLASWIAPDAPPRTQADLNAPNKFWKELTDADAVEISITSDLLTVRLRGGGSSRQWTRERTKGEFNCNNGVVALSKTGGMGGDNVIAFGSDAVYLYRLNDYLIANSKGAAVGAMLLVPVAVYGSSWARFPKKQ